jgi:hypothetical protein
LSQISRVAPITPFHKFGLFYLLQNTYPNYPWNKELLMERKSSVKASQRILMEVVKDIFPSTGSNNYLFYFIFSIDVFEEYVHNGLQFKSGQNMQLDVFVPKYSIAFEYQGEHHFVDIYSLGVQWRNSERDEEKGIACQEAGITLIQVPYWWNFKKNSLMATIYQVREDLISHLPINSTPITKDPPQEFIRGYLL